MVHRLKDVVVVLTGASSGIGASIAEHLLKEGAKVSGIKVVVHMTHDVLVDVLHMQLRIIWDV